MRRRMLFGGLITFTIEGIEYQAKSGMTWGDWVSSSYNTSGYVVTAVYISGRGGNVALSGQGEVDTSDLIIADANYYIAAWAGGGTED